MIHKTNIFIYWSQKFYTDVEIHDAIVQYLFCTLSSHILPGLLVFEHPQKNLDFFIRPAH